MNYEWYIYIDRINIIIYYNFVVFVIFYGIEIEDGLLLRMKVLKEVVDFFVFGNKKKYNVF